MVVNPWCWMMKVYDMTHANDVIRESDLSPTLQARMGTGGNQVPIVMSEQQPVVCVRGNVIGRKPENGGNGLGVNEGIADTLTTLDVHAVTDGLRLRRLTPIECERLQGIPDNWTCIAWRGKTPEECPDAPRYKAIGNSWAVPVIRWIGKRIQNKLEEKQ